MTKILPEWATHRAMWTAWPSHEDLWLDQIGPVREAVTKMVKALAKGERVKLLAMGDQAVADARLIFEQDHVEVIHAQFGDIWLRDTGPIFAQDKYGPIALCFGFNGWGGKYVLDHDPEVSAFIAHHNSSRTKKFDFIMEGGALEFDGEGRLLTTRQCLLHPSRNPNMTEAQIEAALKEAFGIDQVLWLDQGLMNDDHTDGHIDNLARFVGPGHVVCMEASGEDDPNAELYIKTKKDLEAFGLKVTTIPSPGRILDDEGEIAPASHMNFIIGNKVVVMPSYEEIHSKKAVAALQALFPGREVVAVRSDDLLLNGGGSFHCITQQEPA